MEFFEVMRVRRSVRKYEGREIEEEKLKRILLTVDMAPSMGNLQGYEVVVVRDPDTKLLLEKATFNQWFVAEASVVLIFLSNADRYQMRYGNRGVELYSVQDATIACTYAHLTAAALGLGSCWVGLFDEKAVRDAVGAFEFQRPIAILPIGYPTEYPETPSRRPLEEVVYQERVQAKQKRQQPRSTFSTLWEKVGIR